MSEVLKAMSGAGFQMMKGGVDLNDESRFWQCSGFLPGGSYEYRQDLVRPDNGLSALDNVCSTRPALWRRFWRAHTAVHRAIPGHGVRSIDLSGEPARHRG